MFWDAEIPIFLLYFTENALIITGFQNSPKNPLIPQRPNIPKFAFLGEKSLSWQPWV
jgi:hypothetical protein